MRSHRHHRIALRALCVALLLAMVAMPALSIAGELHELAHHLHNEHPAPAHVGDHSNSDELPAPSEGAGQWHLLIHLAHCCGQAAALLPSIVLVDDLRPALFDAGRAPAQRANAGQSRLLRPPIAG